MIEKHIVLEDIDPVIFYGVNNANMQMIKALFPKLRIVPLGAFYALLNKVSLFQMRVDTHKCVSCGACAKACKMDVDITKTPNHAECIRCGMCMKACPTDAIQYKFGLGDQSNTETTKE